VGQFGKFAALYAQLCPFFYEVAAATLQWHWKSSFHAVWPLLLTRWLLQPFGAIGLFFSQQPGWCFQTSLWLVILATIDLVIVQKMHCAPHPTAVNVRGLLATAWLEGGLRLLCSFLSFFLSFLSFFFFLCSWWSKGNFE